MNEVIKELNLKYYILGVSKQPKGNREGWIEFDLAMIENAREEGRKEERARITKEIDSVFKEICHVNIEGNCKYWKVEAFAYDENYRDAVNDKFFPQEVKDKIIGIINL